MSPPASSALFVGVGNAYRRDDGAGLAVARHLAETAPAGLRVETSGGDPASLMELWSGAERLYLADAAAPNGAPGSVRRLDAGTSPLPADFFHSSTHSLGLAEAVELARNLGCLPAHTVVFAIEGGDFEAGEELGPEVAAAARRVAQAILDELQSNPEKKTMHEMSLMKDLMAKIVQVANDNDADGVSSVSVWLGALSHISPEHFTEHFVEAANGTVAEGAKLHIETSDDIHDENAQEILLRNIEVAT